MKIWITGASGLVGRALQKKCKDQSIDFIPTGHQEVDVGSLAEVRQFFHLHPDITHIINCAAFTNVDQAEKEPDAAFKTNAVGPENLGKLARQESLRLVHLSTDYVLGSDQSRPLSEEAPYNPLSVYAKTKKEGEDRLLAVFPQACIVRTSWVFGEGGKNFISTLWNKLQSDRQVPVVFDQVNRLTYAPDLANTILSLLCHDGIYHYANHGIVSRYDVAQKMRQLIKDKGRHLACDEIVKVSSKEFLTAAPRPLYSVLDTKKIENMTGSIPRPWDIALTEYFHEVP